MNVNLTEFEFRSLEKLGNGNADRLFKSLIDCASLDCRNRETDKRSRKVLMSVELFPKFHVEEDGMGRQHNVFDGVGLRIKMDVKLPTRQTIDFDCALDEDNRLLFNPASPQNWRQIPLLPTTDYVRG